MQQGIERGIAEGLKRKSLEIVRSMLDKKIAVEAIAEVTGLSIDEIKMMMKQ